MSNVLLSEKRKCHEVFRGIKPLYCYFESDVVGAIKRIRSKLANIYDYTIGEGTEREELSGMKLKKAWLEIGELIEHIDKELGDVK